MVVFVDEVDQALGQRDTGSSGDSGTSARMFGRILEFMGSNKYRGLIVWFAATNRPDFLDDAMRRRFDRVVPLLIPSQAERELIFTVMPRQILTDKSKVEAFYEKDVDFKEAAGMATGLTGATIEIIVRRAYELANRKPVTNTHLKEARTDFKPNYNQDMYDFQTMLALDQTNFYSMMPGINQEAPYDQPPYHGSGEGFIEEYGDPPRINLEKLRAQIRDYRARLYAARLV